ncbi:MAG: PAS domain S-box protein [Pyrinomonadaceae bacterium]
MIRRKETSSFSEYSVAIFAPVVIGVIIAFSWPFFQTNSVEPFLFAVIFCAWYGGLAPGLISIVFSLVIGWYFFPAQFDLVNFSLFCTAGILISLVGEFTHRAERRATSEADKFAQLETKLQQREVSLIDAQRIANIGNWVLSIETNKFYLSRQIFEIFGIDKTETVTGFEALVDRIHPEDRKRFLAAQNNALAGREPLDIEHRIVLADGTEKIVREVGERTMDVNGQPFSLTGTVIDITDRKHDEEVLRISEELYRLLFETNPFPMWVVEIGTSKFLAVNYAATFFYGYSRAEFMNMTIEDIRPEGYVHDARETGASVRGRLKSEGIWKHRKKHGSVIDVEITSDDLIFDGKPSRLVMSNDVTDREVARLDIQRLNEELEQRVFDRTAQLLVANNELEAFSYSVSHDLRAPLRHINGFSLALLEDYVDVLDETGKNYLREVRGASLEMSLLIEDILQLARVARSAMTRERVDLSGMVHTIVSSLKTESPDRNVIVKIEDGLTARGDKRLIEVMLTNLLGNAWKFTLKKEAAEISFGRQMDSNQTRYFVRDNGAGFDMKYVDKLFGAFQRLHNKSEFEGTGIGLATVQRIVQRHGGNIWAEAAVDDGATFYFTLP